MLMVVTVKNHENSTPFFDNAEDVNITLTGNFLRLFPEMHRGKFEITKILDDNKVRYYTAPGKQN